MSGNDCWNSVCVSRWRKADNELADVTLSGNLFQNCTAATGNARPLTVDSFERRNPQTFRSILLSILLGRNGTYQILSTRIYRGMCSWSLNISISRNIMSLALADNHYGECWIVVCVFFLFHIFFILCTHLYAVYHLPCDRWIKITIDKQRRIGANIQYKSGGRIASLQEMGPKLLSTPHHQDTNTRMCDHITPVLQQLHWLPVRQRVQFKMAVLVYKALHDLLPTYLAEDCQRVSVTGRRQLRSSYINTCLAQRTNTRLGDRSFAAAGPRVWNSLSTQLRESDITLGQFRRKLKTHLFGHWQLPRRVTVFFMRCVLIRLLTYLRRNFDSVISTFTSSQVPSSEIRERPLLVKSWNLPRNLKFLHTGPHSVRSTYHSPCLRRHSVVAVQGRRLAPYGCQRTYVVIWDYEHCVFVQIIRSPTRTPTVCATYWQPRRAPE